MIGLRLAKYLRDELYNLTINDFLDVAGFDSCTDAVEECDFDLYLDLHRDCSEAIAKLEDNLSDLDTEEFLTKYLNVNNYDELMNFLRTHCLDFLRKHAQEFYEQERDKLKKELEHLTYVELY